MEFEGRNINIPQTQQPRLDRFFISEWKVRRVCVIPLYAAGPGFYIMRDRWGASSGGTFLY